MDNFERLTWVPVDGVRIFEGWKKCVLKICRNIRIIRIYGTRGENEEKTKVNPISRLTQKL